MTQGRPRRLQLFYKQEAGREDGGRGLSREGPIGSCLVTPLQNEFVDPGLN